MHAVGDVRHMLIMTSTVLCGSHSGDLVPDLHGSVLESGDIEILDTHVSYFDGQPDPSMVAIPVIKATQRSHEGHEIHFLQTAKHQSI